MSTTILVAGTTAATSTTVTVTAGSEAKIGMFAADATPSVSMRLMMITPGAAIYVCDLTPAHPVVVVGEGDYFVERPKMAVAHGAFSTP